ncbi:hypothetical protein [Bacillus toyonensis]|uniref:hypothetical protein n=1 Tax=Bacillus toyonensis TaxID=155322 RepID=UPI002E21C408|nr:hypothetical protein [Bacillus toyonensis]
MKKKLLIAILGVISILVAGLGVVNYNAHKETQEFNAFRKELDKELLKETSEYITTVTENSGTPEYTDWLIEEKGLENSYKYARELSELRIKIINYDVKYEDTLELKKNALNTITSLENTLTTISTFTDTKDAQLLDSLLSSHLKDLKENVKKQNDILKKYN